MLLYILVITVLVSGAGDICMDVEINIGVEVCVDNGRRYVLWMLVYGNNIYMYIYIVFDLI